MKKILNTIRKHYYTMQTFLNAGSQVPEAEILLYEPIGKDIWGDGIGAKDFAVDLKSLGDVACLNIRINSPGGSVFEGLAIYNLLLAHPAEKKCYIDGVAASIASVIAMAGHSIIMPDNALMMIHDPTALVIGSSEDMRKMADVLDKTKQSLMTAYKTKCTCTDEKLMQMMTDETWLSAQEALDCGLATEIVQPVKMAAIAAFDFSLYQHTPEAIKNAAAAAATGSSGDSASGGGDGNPLAAAAAKRSQAGVIANIQKRKEYHMKKCIHCGADLADGATCACQNVRVAAVKDRNSEISDILAIAAKHNCLPMAQKYIAEGKSKAEFVEAMLTENFTAQPITIPDPIIGMSAKETRAYSIVKAIRDMAESGKVQGLEAEASAAAEKISGRQAQGFFIPQDVMIFNPRNVMQSGDNTKGGFLVGTEVLTGSLIELLRNKTLVAQLGARTLSGLVGNIAIPRVTGGAAAYWLSETSPGTAADQAFGQLGLVPHRLVGDTAYSKELVMQSSVDVEGFIRDDLMRVLAIAKDLAAIAGTGAAGQPQGILNTAGVGSVTFGGAATWAKIIDFETQVANANADLGALAYLTTPACRAKWKAITKIATSQYSDFLWQTGQNGSGMVNGYRAEVTKQVPGDQVIYGNWGDLIFAEWAGVDVVVDPYSLKKSGQIEVTITLWTDIGIRHAASFCISTDTGAA